MEAGAFALRGAAGLSYSLRLAQGEMTDEAQTLSVELPDRYEILREHARGGMATVYLSVDRKHDRRVAIKVLSPDLVAGAAGDRFVREIGVTAQLNHPHILPLLDSGVAGGLPYYVMPFVEGESLRERLARDGQLPVADALRVTKDAGEALDYAHARGLVHRDVKPGNILLTDGGAVVADFGIASAIDQAPGSHLTRTGQSVGTAGYMSPEQASGDSDVDARSDQYSLACVLFEMLAGEPPYTGRTARAIVGKQLSQPVPSISSLRDTVPVGLDEVLRRALARAPADRYTTTGEFTAALEAIGRRPPAGGATPTRSVRPAVVGTLAAVALVAAAALVLPGLVDRPASVDASFQGDTTRYAIFPFQVEGVDIDLNETLRLDDALARWDGLSTVPDFQLRDAIERAGGVELRPDAASDVALAQGAGRFFMGRTDRVGDSLRVAIALYQAASAGPVLIDQRAVRLPVSLAGADAAFEDATAHLLFRGSPPAMSREAAGTSSLPAQQAFEYGMNAVNSWDLARADSGFARAADFDPGYGQAHLWTALVRAWSGADRATWSVPAAQAVLHADRMSERDAAMARVIEAQAGEDPGAACPLWEGLTGDYPRDFAAWYGLAFCLRTDTMVLPDSTSTSGWAFRSSYNQAIAAYQRAFRLLPSILESFHENSYASLRNLLNVSGSTLRLGRDGSGGRVFEGLAILEADTIAFVPRRPDPATPFVGRNAEAAALAVAAQRQVFREVAATWVAASPRSARARQALAVSLMLLGDPTALDTLRRARSLADYEGDWTDLAGLEVWFRLAISLPGDVAGLDRARGLADSLLARLPRDGGAAAGLGASLAALLGRADLAAAFGRRFPPDPSPLGPRAQADARALLIFAAMGGPVDSLSELEHRVATAIDRELKDTEAINERAYRLALPASLAYPNYRFNVASDLDFDRVVAAQSRFAAGDSAAVRTSLEEAGEGRRDIPAYVLTLDTLLPEALLWSLIGEPARAAAWIDPSLAALPEMALDRFTAPEAVGSLVRVAALRARLADRLGRPEEARTWATAVLTLWSGADPAFGELLAEMRHLVD